MLLREKTLVVIVAIFAILILIEFLFSNSIVMGSFYSLEQNDTQQKVSQIEGAYHKDLQSIDALLADRAARDDSYAYMAHPQASYIEQNMRDETFVSQDIDLLLMVDRTGDITYGKAFDMKNRKAVPVPEESIQPLLYNGSPLLLTSAGDNKSGVLDLAEGTMLVAARPILDGKKQGEPRGTMLIGRYVDEGWVDDLAGTTRLNLSMYHVDDPGLPEDVLNARNLSTVDDQPLVVPLDDVVIGGYLVIDDVFDKPTLILRVEQDRPFYAKGIQTIAYVILATLATGVIIAAIAMFLLSKIVLSRLMDLHASVKKITANDDLSARVRVVGSDEISNLSRAINGMLVSLDLSHQKLHESESRYHAVVEDQSELICRFRGDGSIGFANEAYLRHFGMDSRSWPGQNFLHLLPQAARSDVEALLPTLTVTRPAGVLECRFDRDDGAQWLQWSFRAIFDRRGQVSEFQAVGRDITELKRNEEQIKASLKEKDALLKEIHHRVKNNLQIISSILSLQEAQVSDLASREVLADSRNRIKSMALIHERLYGSGDLSSIDFAEYVRNLIGHLSQSYGSDSGRIAVKTDVDGISLNIDVAIPLGLIVNELVTNSFKHAFPGNATGEIFVKLHRESDGKYLLVVGDDGTGMPTGFDLDSTSSLGLQLVHALAQQIDSQVTMVPGKGTVFRISFSA